MVSARRSFGLECGAVGSGLALILLVVIRWYHSGYVIEGGDNFFGFLPFNELKKGFFAWNQFGLYTGAPWSSGTWTAWLFVAGLLGRFVGIGITQIALVAAMMVTAYVAMYAYLKRLGFATVASAIAALGYTCNPWTTFFWGLNYPLGIVIALAPLYAVLITQASSAGTQRRLVLLCTMALSSTLLATIGANPALVVLFVSAVGAGLAVAHSSGVRMDMRWISKVALGNSLAASWWLFLIAFQFMNSDIVASGAGGDFGFVFERSSIVNNLRLNPLWGWSHPEYFPYASSYDGNLLKYAAGFLWSAAVFVAFFRAEVERRRMIVCAAAIFFVSLFLSKGLHEPIGWVNALLYRIPGMSLFREPTSKAPFVAILVATVLLALVIDRGFRWSRPKGWSVAAFCLLAIISSSWPMFVGQQFRHATPNYHPEALGLPSLYTRVPGYWIDARTALAASPAGGVLVLPGDPYYQVDYSWGYYGVDNLPAWLLDKPVLTPGLTGYTSLSANDSLASIVGEGIKQNSPLILSELRDIGIRYVLYRGDVRPSASGGVILTEKDVARAFPDAPRRFGPLAIFAVPDEAGSALERVAPGWIAYDGEAPTAGQQLELRAIDHGLPLVSKPDLSIPLGAPLLHDRVALDSSSRDDSPGVALAPTQYVFGRSMPQQVGYVTAAPSQGIKILTGHSTIQKGNAQLTLAPDQLVKDRPDVDSSKAQLQVLRSQSLNERIMRVAILNPTNAPLVRDLEVVTLSAIADGVILSNQLASYSASPVERSADTEKFRFRNVRLLPGISEFQVSTAGIAPSDRSVRIAKSDLRVGDVSIDSALLSANPMACASQACAGLDFLGSVPVEERLASLRGIRFRGLRYQSHQLLTTLVVSSGSETLRCSALLAVDQYVDIGTIVHSCPAEFMSEGGFYGARLQRIDLYSTGGDDTGDSMYRPLGRPFERIDIDFDEPSSIQGNDVAVSSDRSATVVVNSSEARVYLDAGIPADRQVREGTRVVAVTRTRQDGWIWWSSRVVRGTLIQLGASYVKIRDESGAEIILAASDIVTLRRDDQEPETFAISWRGTKKLKEASALALTLRGLPCLSGEIEISNARGTTRQSFAPNDRQELVGGTLLNARDEAREITVRCSFLGKPGRGELARLSIAAVGLPTAPSVGVGSRRRVLLPDSRNDVRSAAFARVAVNSGELQTVVLSPTRISAANEAVPQVLIQNPVFKVVRAYSDSRILIDADAYSWSWLAVSLRPGSILHHFEVDGWKNAWSISGDSVVLIIQLANVIQLLLLAVAASSIVVMYARR